MIKKSSNAYLINLYLITIFILPTTQISFVVMISVEERIGRYMDKTILQNMTLKMLPHQLLHIGVKMIG